MFGGALRKLLGLITDHNQPAQGAAQTPIPLRTQEQINNSPFKMFEDNSFEGNPESFKATNPGYTFYEDNTFVPPKFQPFRFNGFAGVGGNPQGAPGYGYNPGVPNDFSNNEESPLQGPGAISTPQLSVQPTNNKYRLRY